MPHVPHRHGSFGLAQLLWGACASVVMLFIFLGALGAFDPADELELTIVVALLAALLLTHEWRGLFRAEREQAARRD